MTTTTRPLRVGQVWKTGNRLALTVAYDGHSFVTMRAPTTGRTSRVRVVDGRPNRYTFHSELPRLKCVDLDAANRAAAFLRERGITDVLVDGYTVIAALSVGSVMKLADDALEAGWAHDTDCARMIGDLG